MYVCVAWQVVTEDPDEEKAIDRDVNHAFGPLPRCELLRRVGVLRVATQGELVDLVANLDNIEATAPLKFGYVLLMHTDKDRYRCSESFDVTAARAVTKADPIT